jgi:anti-sigma B factor antagonist
LSDDQVTFTSLGGVAVAHLAGEIDMANAPAIGRAIVRGLTGAGAVLIDLTEVTFLDSAGVRLLDVLVGDLDDHGTPMRFVVDETGAVRKTLELCAFRDDLLATDLKRAADHLNRAYTQASAISRRSSAYPGTP